MRRPDKADDASGTYVLRAPLIVAGVELRAGDVVSLRPDQAERLIVQGTVEPLTPASPGPAED